MLRAPRSGHPTREQPAPPWLLVASLGLSALLHVGAWLFVSFVLRAPELDIEFTLPMDVELGTTESLSPVATPAAESPAQSGVGASAAGAALLDGSVDAAIADAGTDAGPDGAARDGGRAKKQSDGGAEIPALANDGGAEPARLPPGTQIAVRVDMARIRESPIASDVRALLVAIPDWQALLDGSGIDPVEQLDRLLIATPNLQREKLVLAGRHRGGPALVEQAVAQLAAARGVEAPWREQGNVRIAPWANRDATARVIAGIGPSHFAIARAEDLPRVLAIAAARARPKKRGAAAEHPAEALLTMEPDEGLSLEVDGVAQFVRRGRRGIPDKLRVAAIERPGERIELRARFSYGDDARASDAREYLATLRDQYAGNGLIVLLGLSDPLEDAKIEQQAAEVEVTIGLSAEQTRLILGYVRELVSPPATRPPAP